VENAGKESYCCLDGDLGEKELGALKKPTKKKDHEGDPRWIRRGGYAHVGLLGVVGGKATARPKWEWKGA